MTKEIKYCLMFIVIIAVSLISISAFVIPKVFKSTAVISINSTKKQLSPTEKTSLNKTNHFHILVMGDSLAKGTGDVKGKGFAGYFTDDFKLKNGITCKIDNIAVNGTISSGLLNNVQTSRTQQYIKDSNIIFISIGGNDITQFVAADKTIIAEKFNETESDYFKNLSSILNTIKTNNKNCTIIFIGLYNPFENYISSEQLNLLNSWNSSTEKLLSHYSHSVFIPTYDLFKGNLKNYLAADGFHPNSTGYRAISQLILQYLNNSEYSSK